jgi:hypothetical protein
VTVQAARTRSETGGRVPVCRPSPEGPVGPTRGRHRLVAEPLRTLVVTTALRIRTGRRDEHAFVRC